MMGDNGTCENCGEYYIGDGYTVVLHCPYADSDGYEPDATPIDCLTMLHD